MPESSIVFRLLNEIGIVAQLAETRFESVMPAGMTLAQFTVLNHFVRLGGPKSPQALARAFQVSKGTMSSTLGRLDAKGLVTIAPDPNDGRGRSVAITDSGREMREACIAAIAPDLDRWAILLREKDLEAMVSRLAAIREVLDRERSGRST